MFDQLTNSAPQGGSIVPAGWIEEFRLALSEGPEVPLRVLICRLVLALAASAGVAWLYKRTHNGSGAPSLPATLVLLGVLIAAVTQVIGDNVARAFSLVGALSIVRFRTVVRDTRDTAFVIFAVVVGMGIGAGHSMVAAATLFTGGIAAWFTRPKRAARTATQEFKLTVRMGLAMEPQEITRDPFREYLTSWSGFGAATARQGSALEVAWLVTTKPNTSAADLVRALNRVEGVQGIELQPLDEVS
jgi:hypothetical protein